MHVAPILHLDSGSFLSVSKRLRQKIMYFRGVDYKSGKSVTEDIF